MLPSAFVQIESVPLTPNGKVDRASLPDSDGQRPEIDAGYRAANTAVEEVLTGIWSDVLGVEGIGVFDNFFDLGGHSLLATQVTSRIREALRVEVPLRKMFESPTVAELGKDVEQVMRGPAGMRTPAIIHVDRSVPLPLSFAQQRLWFLDQLVPGNP
jgi:acyl carrier protein